MNRDKMIRLIRKCAGFLMKAESVFSVLGSVVLLAAVLIAVVCRYWLYIATPWADELARYLFLWIAFLGMGYVTQINGHIDVQLVDTIVYKHSKNPEKTMKFVIRVSQVLSLVVLVVSTVLYGQFMFARYPSVSTALRIPMRIPYLSTFVGLLLMCLHELSLLFLPFSDPMGMKED